MTTEAPATFAALLRRHRLAAGLSQEALAERAGLSARAVRALEGGQRRAPHPHTVGQLARALRLPLADRARLAAAVPRRQRRTAPGAGPRPERPAPPTGLVGHEAELAEGRGGRAGDAAPPLLVGRDRELARLRALLGAALAGRGGLALIGGEAGIGKTALAEALAREAAGRGAPVLVGRCYDLAEAPPYGPWLELVERLPAGSNRAPLPAPLGGGVPAASQAALFGQVLDRLAAAARPALVLVLDDLHWADPASLDLLRTLARRLGEWPILILATYRADEVSGDHPLARLLPLLAREADAARLDLRRLTGAETRALVRARHRLPAADEARLAAYLHGNAEGNPFYLGELLRDLEEEGLLRPAGDGAALGDLAGVRLPTLLRQVIAGRAARLGPAAEALLAAAAVIGHEPPLALLAAVAGGGEAALRGPVERAVGAGLLAETADGAGVRFAHALVRRALYEGAGVVRRRALHRRVGEALVAAADPDPDAVAHHFRRAGDARAGEWLARAGERAARAYAYPTAAERFAAALALLGDNPAAAGARGGNPGARDRGVALVHAMLGRPEAARPLLERMRAGSRAAGDFTNLTTETGELLAWVALPYGADDPAARRRLAAEAEAAAARASGVLTVEASPGRAYLVALWQVEGRWAEARRLAEEMRAREAASGTTLWRDAYAAVLGELARAQGDAALAWALVREALPRGPATPPGDAYYRAALGLQRLAASLALDAGDPAAARAWLEAHDRWLAWNGAVLGRAEGALGWAAHRRAAGDLAGAEQHAAQALAHAAEPRQPLALLAAHRLGGELDTAAGRHGDATAHLHEALALAEGCGAPYERALTLLATAELRAAAGDVAAARALLDEARALCAPLEAKPALARAEVLAAHLAAPPARVAGDHFPAGLTAREGEVLRLVHICGNHPSV